MKQPLLIIITLLTGMVCKAQPNEPKAPLIQNDVFWYTTDQKPIYSQGGGIFRYPDATTGEYHYYWYGVHYHGAEKYLNSPTQNYNSSFASVTCYRSDDLVNWTFVNDVLTATETNKHQHSFWVGRLGVGYVAKVKKYVMAVQFNSKVLISTCDTPDGDFQWHNLIDMTSLIGTNNTGDQTVFMDDDGTPYLIYSYGKGRNKVYISEIGVTSDGNIGLLNCVQIYKGDGREGNCMFKYQGKYYMFASNLYGWDSSYAYYLEADHIYGPYTPTNNMHILKGCEDDYAHITQTGFFYVLKGSRQETVLYCGDRWCDFAGNGLGYNQWTPLSFKGSEPYFNSLNAWRLDEKTGCWEVDKQNNYVRNASFEADRMNVPSGKKPVQDYLRGWNTQIINGNVVVVGDSTSPMLNKMNTPEDRLEVIGERSLYMSDIADFSRKISQSITSTDFVPLPDGLYKMTAKVKAGKGIKHFTMYATGKKGNYHCSITRRDETWHTVEIKDIEVADGKMEIGFTVEGAAHAYCRADDVTFILQ